MAQEVSRDFTGFSGLDLKKAKDRDAEAYGKIQAGVKAILPGQAGTPLIEPLVQFDSTQCETSYPMDKTLWGRHRIVFGRDRNARSHFSGYGGRGCTSAGSIDIVVGSGGPSPEHRQVAGPNFFTDASRIFLSQRADIDRYLNLSTNPDVGVSPSENRAAIAIKSDSVRIVGREGVRIYTNSRTPWNAGTAIGDIKGRFGEFNSRGERIESDGPERGIHLIAHNKVGKLEVNNPMVPPRLSGWKGVPDPVVYSVNRLQPMVKGENLAMFLNELVEQIKDINQIVQNFTNSQIEFNAAIANHTHVVPAAPGNTAQSIELIATYPVKAVQQLKDHVLEYGKKNEQISIWLKNTYLSSTSPLCFLSRYNKTN